MDNTPVVCAIMLVNGREAMVQRALKCWRAQTYVKKRLLVLDSGAEQIHGTPYGETDATTVWMPGMRAQTIGALRNSANWCAVERYRPEVIVHWDSDDWSHPKRIEEQVATLFLPPSRERHLNPRALIEEQLASLLTAPSGVVGYTEMLFWDSTPGQFAGAWRYRQSNPALPLGTSLCYWSAAWLGCAFEHITPPGGEDVRWLSRQHPYPRGLSSIPAEGRPRMIAAIHGDNTSSQILPEAREWSRAPEYDTYCREVMAL